MESKELRIGNWVQHPEGFNIEVEYVRPELFGEFSPIPLTESILLKCGFWNDTYSNFSRQIGDNAYLVISFRDYACSLICENPNIADHDVNAPCKHLHQLQNLYFALTGRELEIKL